MYRTAACLPNPQPDNALIWPYIKSFPIVSMIRRKCPNLTFKKVESESEEMNAQNFLEKSQLTYSLKEAKISYEK